MNIFDDPYLKLSFAGRLKTRHAGEIKASPLSVGFETLDRELFKPEKCYDLLAELGVKWARCQTGWCRCEKNKGVYDFAWLDDVVDNLLRRGVQPWFNLGYGNILYMKDAPHETAVGHVPTAYGPECVDAWRNYVAALVKHFSSRVKHWEIWNEPNLDCFWRPLQASGANYAGLIEVTSPVIRSLDPEAKVIACSGPEKMIDCAFIRQALLAGMGSHIDIFSIHPYGVIPEKQYFSSVAALRRLLSEYAPHVKLWQGECGYPAQAFGHHGSWNGFYNATEETQAHYVARRVVLDSMMKMELISYYHMTDLMEKPYRQANGQERPPNMLGLLHGLSYTPKKSYYAYKNLAAIFDSECKADDLACVVDESFNFRQVGALPLLSTITGTFVRRGYPVYCYYFVEDLQRCWGGLNNFVLQVVQQTERPIKTPVLIDVISGSVYRATDFEMLESDSVVIRGLPLTDYPLILTDIDAIELQPE